MSSDVRAWIGTVFRVVLAVILFWSGFAKLLEGSDAMRRAIIAYRLGLPNGLTDLIAWGLPTLEIVLGLLLLVGLLTRWAALGTALIMTAFIIGIASVWIRGYSIDCGCFGGGGDTTAAGRDARYAAEIARDLLFAGMAVWLVKWPVTKFSLDRGPRPANAELDDDVYDDDEIDPEDIATEEPTR